MINRVVLVGRLTKDPELRHTKNKIAVATFTLAINRMYENQQYDADYVNCIAWRRQAENISNFLKKGSLIGVEGRLQTRNYEGQNRRLIYITEVVVERVQFLELKKIDYSDPRNIPPAPLPEGYPWSSNSPVLDFPDGRPPF